MKSEPVLNAATTEAERSLTAALRERTAACRPGESLNLSDLPRQDPYGGDVPADREGGMIGEG